MSVMLSSVFDRLHETAPDFHLLKDATALLTTLSCQKCSSILQKMKVKIRQTASEMV